MTVINIETLDKLDRFRTQAIIDIKGLELPPELEISFRHNFSQFLDKSIQSAIDPAATAPTNQPTTTGLEF
jgi:hypothetical protein